MLPFLSYAEIHYRIPGIFSRLFHREPEIIFDLPYRGVKGNDVPLFLFVKDADRFQCQLERIAVHISTEQGQTGTWEKTLNQACDTRFSARTFRLPARHFAETGRYFLEAQLWYSIRQGKRVLVQDNYRHIPRHPFQIDIAGEGLPILPGLRWGDVHLHSNYTDDQIEFGAPIAETAICARSLGLDFIGITDHSYDLDDLPGDYTRNDPDLKKWQTQQQEITHLNAEEKEFVILNGEEVSVGNHQRENVHCLILGNRQYHPGDGDSGEKPLRTRPTSALPELLKNARREAEVIIAAAHPFDAPPLSQRLILNRGHWRRKDLTLQELDYWQILNGRIDRAFQKGLNRWRKVLLSGHQVGILGGTDAHGNFNRYRQITIPFLRMVNELQQRLGETRSGIYCEGELSRDNLLTSLRQKQVIISNGPAANLLIAGTQRTSSIGSSISANEAFQLSIQCSTSDEFGRLAQINLYIGDYSASREETRSIEFLPSLMTVERPLHFSSGLPPGYLRLEVRTDLQYFCLTNPIWIT